MMERCRSSKQRSTFTAQDEKVTGDVSAERGGVESHCPPLFWVLAGVGVHLVGRGPGHRYCLAYWRLVPLACLASAFIWATVTTHHMYQLDYRRIFNILTFLFSAVYSLGTVSTMLIKSGSLCKLLSALSTSVPRPSFVRQTVLGCVCLIYFLGRAALFPVFTVPRDMILRSVIHFLVIAGIPAALDLYSVLILNSLVRVYRTAQQDILRDGQRPVEGEDNIYPYVIHVKQAEGEETFVTQTTHRCQHLRRLTNLYNQVFSWCMVLRCQTFLIKASTLTFNLVVGNATTSFILTLLDEAARFAVVCWQADQLTQAHQQVEDAVWALAEDPRLPDPQRSRSHALASHLVARPASVSVGAMTTLGTGLLAVLVNAAFTYAIILYQSQPPKEL